MIHTIKINIPTIAEMRASQTAFFYALSKKYLTLEDRFFYKAHKNIWILHYKLTGRCGGRINAHFPIYGNHHPWLWKTSRRKDRVKNTCSICGFSYSYEERLGTSFKNYSNLGREADWKSLEKGLKTATNETERRAIRKSMNQITHEDKRVRAMREDLIKATRNNDHERIKDIHDYIHNKKVYINER